MDGLPADRWGGGSIMTAVCYDVLNQVLFDKTVLSTSVFIVSPVSPSTKAGWWYVSVLVQWGVWGSAREWPAHPSGPRAEAVPGYRIADRTAVSLNLWNVSQAKSQYQLYLLSRSKLFRRRSLRIYWKLLERASRGWSGHPFHVADFYEWGRGSHFV